MQNNQRLIRIMMYLGITALVLIILYLSTLLFGTFFTRFAKAANSIILPFSIALFISYLLAPVFKLLERNLKFKFRMLNTIIVFVATGFILFLFGRYAFSLIYEQGVNFVENDWPVVVSTIEVAVADYAFLENLYERIVKLLTVDNLLEAELDLFGVFESVTTFIITIVLVPVFLFFILNDSTKIYDATIMLFPKKIRKHAVELLSRANRVIEQYFNGRFATMFVMAIAFTIMFFVLGFRQRSLLFGFMLGFFDIVPYVGPFIAMVLPILYSLTDDTLMFGNYAPLAIGIAVVVGQMIQNNVAQPFIMGKETKLHPMLVLSAFVFFGYLFGVVGIILAIPITGMIRTSIKYVAEINEEKIQKNKAEVQRLREDVNHEGD